MYALLVHCEGNSPVTSALTAQMASNVKSIHVVNNPAGAAPFENLNVGDVGDLKICPYDIQRAVAEIREGYSKIISNGCKALAIGGDHTITYPILQAIKVSVLSVPWIHPWKQRIQYSRQ